MANSKISALPSATTPLAGTEVLPVVQGGITEQVSVANLTAGRDVSASGLFVDANSATSAIRVTQLGAGNVLTVEDSASPDATPFVINNAGNTFIGYGTSNAPSAVSGCEFQVNSVGTTQASIFAAQWGVNSTGSAQILLAHSLSGVRGTQSIVSSGAALGKIRSFGSDGTNFIEATSIESYVDGTPGTNDMPGKLVFSTTADGASSVTERVRIDSVGNTYVETGVLWQYAPAPTAKSAAATLTAAELQTGILSTTGTTYTITLPTGTAIDAGFTSVPTTGIGFDWYVVNTATGIITIAVGASGMTSLGALTVAIGASAHFRFRRTAANTYVLYRLS
jgi:hypothetical protein